MNKYVFTERGNVYSQIESNFALQDTLPKGIYNMMYDDRQGIYLEKVAEEFYFGYKLYGLDTKLVNHVVTYYHSKPHGNIGVLCQGVKGTGKTVTTKCIANQLGLPVIIINCNYPGLTDFIAKCQQDCIFLLDEFEKNFNAGCDIDGDAMAGQSLLSVMDGIYNSDYTHIFLLTTNKLHVNDNLLSRPSRIRYLKEFPSILPESIVKEFVSDNLEDKSKTQDLLDFINTLEISTIDIIKSIIDELNIQKCEIDDLKGMFNVKTCQYRVSVDEIYARKNDSVWDKYKTLDDFTKMMNLPYDKRDRNVDYDSYTVDYPMANLKVGGIFCGWKIVKIDTVNRTMELELEDRRYRKMVKIISYSKSNGINYAF